MNLHNILSNSKLRNVKLFLKIRFFAASQQVGILINFMIKLKGKSTIIRIIRKMSKYCSQLKIRLLSRITIKKSRLEKTKEIQSKQKRLKILILQAKRNMKKNKNKKLKKGQNKGYKKKKLKKKKQKKKIKKKDNSNNPKLKHYKKQIKQNNGNPKSIFLMISWTSNLILITKAEIFLK